jgi:two-component system chemotaxis response regulator CheB
MPPVLRPAGDVESPFWLVVMGASSGAIDALKAILSRLPEAFPVPIVLVVHMSPRSTSVLDAILRKVSALEVTFAVEGDRLRGGHVYIAPPDHHVRVRGDLTLHLSQSRRVHFARPAVDPLFTSAAAFGRKTLAVVLTGYGSDGSDGARDIRAAGGTILTQDEHSSFAPQMPLASQESADVVLPLDSIAPALISLTMMKSTRPIFGLPR